MTNLQIENEDNIFKIQLLTLYIVMHCNCRYDIMY